LLVPPGDVRGLRRALDELVEDRALRNQLGAAARRRADELTASRIVPRFEAAYEHVVRERKQRGSA
jgi:glycosyltransferase involved in cell wall biosynthesis